MRNGRSLRGGSVRDRRRLRARLCALAPLALLRGDAAPPMARAPRGVVRPEMLFEARVRVELPGDATGEVRLEDTRSRVVAALRLRGAAPAPPAAEAAFLVYRG